MPDLELKDVVKAVEGVNVAFEAFKVSNDDNLAKRDVVTEEKLTRIEASIAAAQAVADEAVLAAKRSSRVVTDESGNAIDLDKKANDWARAVARERNDSAPASFDAEGLKAYGAILDEYLRKGDRTMAANELKTLSVGNDPNGGYTVTPDVSGRISMRVFETSPMRAYASAQTISTDTLKGRYDNDEAGSGWVSETGARPQTSTPKLGEWSIPVREQYAMPDATQQLLDDSSINMESWLADKVSSKFARDEALEMVVGAGVSGPRGFLTYPAGTDHKQIEQIKTGVNGGFAATPNAVDTLIDVQYAIKSVYRANANWFMNRATIGAVRKLKDTDGAYIWQPGASAGLPSTLLGYGIGTFEDMPNIATGSLSIAFGDMRDTYQIVDRQGIRVLRDPFTSKPYVLFYTTKRVGGDVVNFEALKLVQFSA